MVHLGINLLKESAPDILLSSIFKFNQTESVIFYRLIILQESLF